MIEIRDWDGVPRDWAWVHAQYGADATVVDASEDGAYRVTRLVGRRTTEDPGSWVATVLDEDGAPEPGRTVRMARIGTNVAQDVVTDDLGRAVFWIPREERYPVPGQGPMGMFLAGLPKSRRDDVAWLGRAWGGRDGDKFLDVTWRAGGEPEPPPDTWPARVLATLADVRGLHTELEAALCELEAIVREKT